MNIRLVVLFLLLSSTALASKYHYSYTSNCEQAYRYYMALQPQKAQESIRKAFVADPYNLLPTYLADYDDCLLLLFNGDDLDYEQRKHHLSARLKMLDKGDETSPWFRLCKAGIYMHWAFIHVRFEENLKAAANLRKSFSLLKENRKKFPDFEYNNIFFGIQEAALGAMPNNYKWIAAIFGMKGNVHSGDTKLKTFIANHKMGDPFYQEALIYYTYLNYFIMSDKAKAWEIVNSEDFGTDENLVNSFIKGNIALNYRKARSAEDIFNAATEIENYGDYPVLDFEYGLAKYNSLDYGAVELFKRFLNNYKGKIFIKDAWQKIAYMHHLKGESKGAEEARLKVLSLGTTMTDADKQALRFAKNNIWPNRKLLKVQLLTDGGHYNKANELLKAMNENSFSNDGWKAEYYFRKGRVAEERKQYEQAIISYNKAISLGRHRQEQYAARSALQSGFIHEKLSNLAEAIKAYELALSMKDHDYKNAIDQQAKAGVKRLSE